MITIVFNDLMLREVARAIRCRALSPHSGFTAPRWADNSLFFTYARGEEMSPSERIRLKALLRSGWIFVRSVEWLGRHRRVRLGRTYFAVGSRMLRTLMSGPSF